MASKKNVQLPLVRAAPDQKLTLYQLLNFLIMFLPGMLVSVPLATFYHHVIARRWSPIVQKIGRPFFADFVVRLTRFVMSRSTPAQIRILMNRSLSYKVVHAGPDFWKYRSWLSYVKVNGTAGRWIAKPNTSRKDDDVVLYFVHGGGFVMDTGANSEKWALELVKEMNLRRRVNFSMFSLDYRLAPEYKYPSQIIEALAGYHYLVNDLGIAPEKICISGDSAGGNIVAAFLLHLARPNPIIRVPESLGPTPARPGAVLFISPFISLISHLKSRDDNEQFDFIETTGTYAVALDYIGLKLPHVKSRTPSWNPLLWVRKPYSPAPKGLIKKFHNFQASDEKHLKGQELFSSPYVNPIVCDDPKWWAEALPGNGRTMVSWGGAEIFADDVVQFVEMLKKAGLEPVETCKPLAAHDAIMFDYSITGLFTTHSFGLDQHYSWGMEQCADFLQETELRARRAHWEAVATSKKAAAVPVSKMEAAGQVPEETPSADAEDVAESAVLVANEKKNAPKEPAQAKKGAKSGKR